MNLPPVITSVGGTAVADTAATVVFTILDPSEGQSTSGVLLGDSPGQTFMAADTLMRSLTVWRHASQLRNGIGMQLFITETDSTGFPLFTRIVLAGPTIVRTDGDGINPTPFQWSFDPPLSLPGRGTYAFFLSPDPCWGFYDLITSGIGVDLYAGGRLWGSGRGCPLIGYPYPKLVADMIFQIVFCSTDTTTPTRSTSWGSVKVIYR